MTANPLKCNGKPASAVIVAGIDVHKYKLQVFVLGRINYENRPLGEHAFMNTSEGRHELCCFLDKYYPNEIVMEKTGKLSDPVLKVIEKHRGWHEGVPRVLVVAPDTIKRFAGEKHTDRKSAHDLALLGVSGILTTTYIPSLAGKQLKELTREREQYVKKSTALINQIKDRLGGLGYTLPKFSVTSAWGLAFLQLLLAEGIEGNITKVYALLEAGHVTIHVASKRAILERKNIFFKYSHLSIPGHDIRCLRRNLIELEMIEAIKAMNEGHIEDLVNKTGLIKDKVQAIERVAGISDKGATMIVAEVDDMARFPTWRQFALYAGRAIASDESGEHVGKPHMTKRCNHHLKEVFKQSGIIACFRLKEDSDIKRYAMRQMAKHRMAPMVACANTSAKIVHVVYKILHDGATYDPLHDTKKKCIHVESGTTPMAATWQLKLKEARKRASKFKRFTEKTIVDLPPGEMKDALSKVLDVFNKAFS